MKDSEPATYARPRATQARDVSTNGALGNRSRQRFLQLGSSFGVEAGDIVACRADA